MIEWDMGCSPMALATREELLSHAKVGGQPRYIFGDSGASMNDELDQFLRSLLRPGMEISLRGTLRLAKGTYKIITINDAAVKVRRGRGDAIVLQRTEFDLLVTAYVSGPGGSHTGVLGALGYHVGRDGLSVGARHYLLVDVLLREQLPPVQGVTEWGAPRSPQRLIKLAKCLSTFARNAQNRADSPIEAIEDWLADLAWLRDEFESRFGLTWWPEA